MSIPILPFAVWASGTNQNSTPANDNSLRNQILNGLVISDSTTVQPSLVSPADDGAIYIIPAGATGTQWATFDEFDLAIFVGGTWLAFAPVKGITVNLAGALIAWDGAAYVAVGGGGGGSVAGADKQIQYNNAGSFGAEAGFEYDQSTNTQSVPNQVLSGLQNLAKASNIASAGTTNIAAATGNLVHITGTTTITGLGTAQAGAERTVIFDGILTLTHNGTSLILPTGANITTAAGDAALFVSEGSGNWKCVAYQKADGTALAGGGGGGLTGFTSTLETASPNNATNVSTLTASGGTTDQNAALVAKGTGATLAQVPDSTTTGGNVRAARATDLQKQRGNATQVASGTNSALIGGLSNTASGNYSFAMGDTNTASGDSSIALGKNCTASQNRTVALGDFASASAAYAFAQGFGCSASGQNAVSMGESTAASGTHSQAFGSNTTANANYSQASGLYSSAKTVIGAWARASYRFSSTGDAQSRQFQLSSDTTNATPEAVSTNNSAAATSNQITLDNNSSYVIKGTVVARENATGDTKSWEFTAHIKRGANAAATAMVAAATVTGIAADAGAAAWALAVTANTTLGCLSISVTGEAAKTIKWTSHVYSCNEVVG